MPLRQGRTLPQRSPRDNAERRVLTRAQLDALAGKLDLERLGAVDSKEGYLSFTFRAETSPSWFIVTSKLTG